MYINEFLRANQDIKKEVIYKPYKELVKIYGNPSPKK